MDALLMETDAYSKPPVAIPRVCQPSRITREKDTGVRCGILELRMLCTYGDQYYAGLTGASPSYSVPTHSPCQGSKW